MLSARLRCFPAVLAATAVLQVVAASDPAPPSAAPSLAGSPPVALEEPSPVASAEPSPGLVTDPADEVLVPVMSGTGPGRTPPFEISGGVFTVRIACLGGGTATLVTDGEDRDVVCDDRMHRMHTVTDSRTADAQVRATVEQRWSMTVVVTDAVRRTP